jgi:hypothetical protein
MPDEVIVPVLHSGSGEVHDISVPHDTPLSELHDALLDKGYHSDWVPYQGASVDSQGHPKQGPTKEGSVEYDPKFKETASKVWETAERGKSSTESGTYLEANLDRGPIATSNEDGKMSLVTPKDAPYTMHTHPDHFKDGSAGGQPSGKDIETAKKLGKYVYVVSRSGLSYVGPHGEQGVVYTNPKQFEDKKKKE